MRPIEVTYFTYTHSNPPLPMRFILLFSYSDLSLVHSFPQKIKKAELLPTLHFLNHYHNWLNIIPVPMYGLVSGRILQTTPSAA